MDSDFQLSSRRPIYNTGILAQPLYKLHEELCVSKLRCGGGALSENEISERPLGSAIFVTNLSSMAVARKLPLIISQAACVREL